MSCASWEDDRIMRHKLGWEDYDLWCSLIDHGLKGCHVPQILCRYRVHGKSMMRTVTMPSLDSDPQGIRATSRRIMGSLSFSDRLLWCSFAADKVAVMVSTVSYTHLRAHETDSYLVC